METRLNPSFFLKAIFLCLTMCVGVSGAKAQTGNTLLLSVPDSSEYPLITVYIDPEIRNENPQDPISSDQITISENGINRDPIEIKALNPGIQLVIAFNFSTPFAIQDINGRSRFDFIQESLINWAAQPLDSAADDISIIDNRELELVHVEEKSEWVKALEELDPPLRETESNFSVLARAIEIASDPVSQPGMKKVVLLFSTQPEPEGFETIDSLIAQAADNQVQIYSILVSSPALFESGGAVKLQTLASATRGNFLTFSGEEPFPDLGQLLLPLRTTYMLKYQSSIVTAGTHRLEISIAGTPISFDGMREFTLDIQPPNPIFITPPQSITRTPIEEESEDPDQIMLEPATQILPVLVEFPDQHPREVEELIFRVDGEIVEIKASPPYDQFTWNLEEYLVSGTHYLTLEAVDIMGLSRLSVETPIEIEVILPTEDIWDIARKNTPALLGLALILILGLTFFVLISQGRIKPREKRVSKWFKQQRINTVGIFRGIFQFRKGNSKPAARKDVSPYRLTAVNDISRELFPEPIQIHQPEISFGAVSLENSIKIQHPSIISEHARITSLEGDQSQITDLGSTAGTWINYQQIPPSIPHGLEDGDIINIGEAAFRFQLMDGPNSLAANKEK